MMNYSNNHRSATIGDQVKKCRLGAFLPRLFLLLALLCTVGYGQVLRSVQVEGGSAGVSSPHELIVTITGERLPAPKVSWWRHRYLIFEFQARFAGKGRKQRLQTPFVIALQYGWYTATPPRTRVVLTVKGPLSYQLQKTEEGYRLTVRNPNAPTPGPAPSLPAQEPKQEEGHPEGQGSQVAPSKAKPQVPTILSQGSESRASTPPPPRLSNPSSPPSEPVRVASLQPPASLAERQVALGRRESPSRSVPPATARELRISVDFVGAEIGDVLKAIAIQSGVNIVTAPDVKGTITVSLSKVTAEEALDLIARLSGYRYRRIGNTYVVGSPKALESFEDGKTLPSAGQAKRETVVEVVRVQYSSLDTLLQMVKAVMSEIAEEEPLYLSGSSGKQDEKTDGSKGGGSGKEGGSSTEAWDPRQDRFLIIGGSPNVVAAAKAFAEELDQQFGKAMASGQTLEVYQAKHVDAITLKGVLEGRLTLQTGTGSAGGTGGDGSPSVGGLSADGSPGTGGQSGGTPKAFPLFPTVRLSIGPTPAITKHNVSIAQVGAQSTTSGGAANRGTEPPMTLILQGPEGDVKRAVAFLEKIDVPTPQVKIEAKVADLSAKALRNLGINWSVTQTANPSGQNQLKVDTIPDVNKSLGIQVSKLSGVYQISANLDALFQDSRNRLLASPNISVLDGRYAEIFIGDEIRYVESITQGTTGPSITVGVVKAGIQLNVSPRINFDDKTITLTLHPEVSVITGFLEAPGGGNLPQIARRYAETTVRVRDGETLVIGGLIRDDEIRTVQKVPLLGDLPFFGYLFRKTTSQKDKSEIVILITVHILKE